MNYITAIWQTDENVSLENVPVLGNCQSYEKVLFVAVKMNEVGKKQENDDFRSKFIDVAILGNFLYEGFFSCW